MNDINGKKSEFFSKYWVEERHDYLKSIPSSEAKEVVESFSNEEVELNVNCRKFQEAYICDYLEDLWSISPQAFWQHIKISLRHPLGTLVSDNNFHLEIMKNEKMPDDVWIAVLESLLFIEHKWDRNIIVEVIKAQTAKSKNRECMQKKLIEWIKDMDTRSKEHVMKILVEMREKYDIETTNMYPINKEYVIKIFKEIFNDETPKLLKEFLENE